MAVFTAIGAAVFGAGTFLAGLTAAGLQIAAGIALSAISKSMQGDQQAAKPKFGVQGQLQGGDEVPRSINLGWNCTAGSLVYHNTWGDGGVMSTRVMALGDYPIQAFVGLEVDGVAQSMVGSTTHPSYGASVPSFYKNGKDHLWIKFYDGTQTTADTYLTGTVSSGDRPYGSSRVGVGVPYVIVTALAPERADGEEKPLFQGLPTFKFITYGARLYDPSRDDTVGGSGSQRWSNPATWGGDGDFLPPVQIYNLLRGVYFNNQWLYGLQSVNAARVDNATFIAGINKARTGIAGPSGTEPTFRAGGEMQVGAQIHQAIEALITACNGRLVEAGGTYKLYVGEPGSPVMSFTDGDILSTEEQSFSPFLRLSDTVNGVAASYPTPTEGWNTKTAPPLLRPDLEVLDGNRRLLASVSLDLVPYPGQVQRLMQWSLAEALRARRHTFVLGPEFRVVEPGDVVMWSSVRNGYEDKLFRVDGVVYKSNLDVIVDLTEVDPADYDWDQEVDYRPVIDGPISLVGPRPMPMSGWQVFPGEIRDNDGNGRRPSIEVWTASGVAGVDGVRVQVRLAEEELPFFDSPPLPYGTPWKWILQGSFPPNVACEVRGIFMGPANSQWSEWLSVTTPNIKLGADDIDITFAEIAAEIVEKINSISIDARDAADQIERLGTLLSEQDLANFNEQQGIKRDLRKKVGDLEAGFIEFIEVALGPGGAIAQSLTTLYAAMGGDSAQVLVRYQAIAAPDGVSARWAVQVSSDGSTFASAGMYLDLMPGGATRIVLAADQTVVSSGDGSDVFALFNEDGLMVRDITAARIESADGASFWDLTTGAFRISTP